MPPVDLADNFLSKVEIKKCYRDSVGLPLSDNTVCNTGLVIMGNTLEC
jgi:hypothetical protein